MGEMEKGEWDVINLFDAMPRLSTMSDNSSHDSLYSLDLVE